MSKSGQSWFIVAPGCNYHQPSWSQQFVKQLSDSISRHYGHWTCDSFGLTRDIRRIWNTIGRHDYIMGISLINPILMVGKRINQCFTMLYHYLPWNPVGCVGISAQFTACAGFTPESWQPQTVRPFLWWILFISQIIVMSFPYFACLETTALPGSWAMLGQSRVKPYSSTRTTASGF